MKNLLSALCCFVVSSSAAASFVFSPGISHSTDSQEASQPNTVDSEVTETNIDLKLGYVLPMGLYLGGMYSSLSTKSGGTSNSGNLIGPSIGYYSPMGFYTMLTYHIMGEISTSATETLTGAKGPQVDMGWVFPLSSYFAIGPQLTWRSTEFDKIESATATVDTDYSRTTISPYISLWFMF